jgi:hypothetical protein
VNVHVPIRILHTHLIMYPIRSIPMDVVTFVHYYLTNRLFYVGQALAIWKRKKEI